jgi:TfoX/Sxy family transcriptional regulator of competence genes
MSEAPILRVLRTGARHEMLNMASSQSTVDFIIAQMQSAGVMHAKKMFGEYGIYCDDKLVALVCDDQLYVKPTAAGRAFVGDCIERCPYPGAKPCLAISVDKWDDRQWLSRLIQLTAQQLPAPKGQAAALKGRSGRSG